jgi:hypothetical protein
MSDFEYLADVADVPEGALIGVQRSNGDDVCLYNYRGSIGAVGNVCTHAAQRRDDRVRVARRSVRLAYRTRAPRSSRRSAAGVSGADRRRTGARGDARDMIVDLADFPLLAGNPDLHYLDSAATSQKPQVVLDAMMHYYTHDNANPHRGAYALSARATERYHQAREDIARFVGVRDATRLVFTRGTTESLNLVATAWGRANVAAGDEIVITGLEHHANFVPWQQLANEKGAALRICRITPDGRIDLDHLASLVGPRTKVVAFAHVSISTRSADTRCSGRWAAACWWGGARCSRQCRHTKRAAT